jgi:hypothetical protein
MRAYCVLLSLVIIFSVNITAPAMGAPISIVVDFGDYPSAQAAAHDEENVDWRDADRVDDTRCTQAFAATELQHYLRKITGHSDDFALVDDDCLPTGDLILIGGPRSNRAARKLRPRLGLTAEELDNLGVEGYRLKRVTVSGRHVLVVAGGGRIGTLYGTYDLLYRLGCRWFAPGEVHEEIPSLPLNHLPNLDVTERPKFYTRGFHSWENRGDHDFLLWMARNRLNYWCHEQKPHALLRKLGIMMSCGGHVMTPLYIGPRREYPYDHRKFHDDESHPPDPYPVSKDFQGDLNKDGKLSYSEAHPEWYAFLGGKRSFNISSWGTGDNFCTSNEHALTEFVKGAVQDLIDGRHADADIVNAWMLDCGRWCECDKCRSLGTPTDRNLLVVHALAQGIRKAQQEGFINRRIRLFFLAYADVMEPPTRPLPADFNYDMSIATFLPIVRCYVHSLDEETCARNRWYYRHLQRWAVEAERYYQGELCIGEYYNVSGYKSLPICYMHSMAHDIPLYYTLGARHFYYMHCTTDNWGNKALTNYQMSRQLWDPETDCEALWRDYFRRRYGAAALTMRRFYESLEVMLSNVSELKYGLARRLDSGAENLFPSSHMQYEKREYSDNDGIDFVEMLDACKRCRALIDEALKKELPPRVRARVEEDERLFTYGERTLEFFDAQCRAYLAARKGEKQQARAAYKEAQDLAALLKADETSTKFSSSHANARNALAASYAAGGLTHLEELIVPAEPQ